MIIFLKIEAIEKKKEKKAGRYSLRLEAKEDEINQKLLRGGPDASRGGFLEKSPPGHQRQSNYAAVEIDIDESLTRKLQDFAEFHKDPGSVKNIRIAETLADQLQWEETLGIEIYQTFFPGIIGETFGDCLNLLLQEKIDNLALIISSSVPWILDIPFEMMRKDRGSTPLSLFHEHFHLVHSIESGHSGFQEAVLDASAPPLKILFVSALPVDLPDEERLIELEREQELLISAVGELISEQKVVVEFLDIATLEEIEKSLQEGQHQVIHFSGHGSHPEASSQDSGVLYLEDEWGNVKAVTGQELAQSLEKFSSIRLVVLSACETARAGESGVAGALLKAGIPAVLGMRYHVGDEAARNFTTCFYEDICAGKSLDYAVYSGRKMVYDTDMEKIEARKGQNDDSLFVTEWMTPFLFQSKNIRQLLDYTKEPGDTLHFLHQPQSPLVEGAKYMGRGFIGRHKEILQLYRLFREGNRSICIYGQSGTGKTTLAVRFAHHFERGAFRIIRFDNTTSQESILSRLAEEATPSLGEGIKNFVQSPDYDPITKLNLMIEDFLSKQKIIILFDNFEENQVSPQSSEHKAKSGKVYQREIYSESLKAFLVHLCKNVKKSSYILFTTRYLFSEPAIAPLNLGEMRFSDTFKLVNRFEKLARLSPKEKWRIHQKLGGHPRALELLESCVSHENIGWESVSQGFQEVEDREINQDLLLDMLWNQLSNAERLALMGASIFRGQTAPEGLMAVINNEKETTQKYLYALNALSLIYLEDNQFYSHRLTAIFIQATKMDESQTNNFHLKAAEYFENKRGGERKKVLNLLEARWHYLQAQMWDIAANLTCRMIQYLSRWGYSRLSFELLTEILAKNIVEKSRSNVYLLLGSLYSDLDDYEQALKEYRKSQEIKKRNRDINGMSDCLTHIGNVYFFKADYDQALIQYQRAMKISKRNKNILGLSDSFRNIAMIHQSRGNYELALNHYEKSLEISEKIGDTIGVSESLNGIGNIYYLKHCYKRALKYYKESLNMFEKINDIKRISNCVLQIGNIYRAKCDYVQALNHYENSLSIIEKSGNIQVLSGCMTEIGKICHLKGDYSQALHWYKKSMENFERIGDIKGGSNVLHQIGMLYQEQGHFFEALIHYKKALEIFEKIGDTRGVANVLHNIGAIYQIQRNLDAALMHYKKALEMFEKGGDIKGVSNSMHQIGIIYKDKGNYEAALINYKKSKEIDEKIGDRKGISSSLHQIGMIYHIKDDYESAITHYQEALEISEEIGDIVGTALRCAQIGKLFSEREDLHTALNYLGRAFLIFSKTGSPQIQIVKKNILKIRNKLPKTQFNEILSRMKIPLSTFYDEEFQQSEAVGFLTKLAIESISEGEKGIEKKKIPLKPIKWLKKF